MEDLGVGVCRDEFLVLPFFALMRGRSQNLIGFSLLISYVSLSLALSTIAWAQALNICYLHN